MPGINKIGKSVLASIALFAVLGLSGLSTGCCRMSCCKKCQGNNQMNTERKSVNGTLTVLHLNGSWYEMGVQYGTLMKNEMKAVRDFAGLKNQTPSDPILLPKGLPCGVEFIDELMRGAAEGAGLTLDDMAIINAVEIAYLDDSSDETELYSGKCSALALFGNKVKNGRRVYGRNYDWLSSFMNVGLVVTYFHPKGTELEVASINYPGCFYMTTGMNSAGLFIELNDGSYSSLDSNDKCIHNAWLLWNVLLQTRNTKQAVNMLQSLSPKGNYLIGITDPEDNAVFEWGVSSNYVHHADNASGVLAMTNHFLRPDWKNTEYAGWGGIASSVNRYKAIRKLGEDVPDGTGDVDTLKKILAIPVEEGGAKWLGTIFQVIAVPELREMHVHCCNSDEWIPVHFDANSCRKKKNCPKANKQ